MHWYTTESLQYPFIGLRGGHVLLVRFNGVPFFKWRVTDFHLENNRPPDDDAVLLPLSTEGSWVKPVLKTVPMAGSTTYDLLVDGNVTERMNRLPSSLSGAPWPLRSRWQGTWVRSISHALVSALSLICDLVRVTSDATPSHSRCSAPEARLATEMLWRSIGSYAQSRGWRMERSPSGDCPEDWLYPGSCSIVMPGGETPFTVNALPKKPPRFVVFLMQTPCPTLPQLLLVPFASLPEVLEFLSHYELCLDGKAR